MGNKEFFRFPMDAGEFWDSTGELAVPTGEFSVFTVELEGGNW